MKKIIIVSFFSLLIFILLCELFYFLNFSNYSFNTIKYFDNIIYNYLYKFIIYFIFLNIFGILVKKLLKLKYLNMYVSISTLAQIISTIIIIYYKNHNQIDFQSTLTIIFLSILNSYNFFYSILFENVVK